jgi:precorrin-2 dehydrogenase/sirohydrochlorin ferrochelatase
MPDYPILLQLAGTCCLVVGGGPVGLRKVRGLLAAGARVRLVSTVMPRAAQALDIERIERPFRPDDLHGVALAFAASGDADCDRHVATEARRRGIPVCLAAQPAQSDFTLPALLRRGELTVAVSTGGQSPALAVAVRDRLAHWLPPEWSTALKIAAALRRRSQNAPGTTAGSRQQVRELLDGPLLQRLAARDRAGVDRLLQKVCGPNCSLASLGICWPEETS